MSWKKEVEQIKLRKSLALQLGGKEKVKKQHDAGRLTVRERISYLLDKDSFNEVGILAGQSSYDSIGNLKDITLRCLEVLKSSEYILVESSAHSSKLLNEYNIDNKLVTFNKDNEKRKINSITDDLSNGAKICLISDAGTPSISDPGFELIRFIRPPIK